LSAAPAGAATVSATAHHVAAGQTQASSASLMSSVRQTAAQKAHQAHVAHVAHEAKTSLPTHYTVKSGDSLAAIAQRFYHNPDAWPVLYWANNRQIHWANEIQTGQVLQVPVKPARIPNAPGQLGPAPAPAPVQTSAPVQASAPVQGGQAAPVQYSTPAAPAAPVAQAPAATYSGSGSFQSCVIARESGGNSQVMNSSGHYGLYQFSASTWAAYGGNPGSFGSASVAQQNQVFNNAIAAGGQSNWSAYDGC
jgi:LysM repeat protein